MCLHLSDNLIEAGGSKMASLTRLTVGAGCELGLSMWFLMLSVNPGFSK